MSYEIDIEKVTCSCLDFKFRRHRNPKGSLERRCKHLAEVMKDIPIIKSKTWSEKKRHPRVKVEEIAKIIGKILLNSKSVEQFEFCGSYRRKKNTIGDLDVVISLYNDHREKGIAIIEKIQEIASKTMVNGKQKTSLVVNGVQIDLRFVYKSTFIFQVMHATGSMGENIRLRAIAKRKGMALSEYGLRGRDRNYIPNLDSEEKIYKALNQTFVKPSQR